MAREPSADRRAKRTAGPSGQATLYDVAERAGVSAMTVSRVTNGSAHVSEASREAVMRAIQELGYKVNVAARTARIGTLRVGLLYSNPSAAFLSAFLVGAMTQCNASGAQMLLEQCEDPKSQRKGIDRLIANGADAILVPPPLCDSPAWLKHLVALGLPAVAVATGKPSPLVSAVRIDDYAGARVLMQHLLDQGHRDIAFIEGDPLHTPALLRLRAYQDAMSEAGLALDPARVRPGLFTYRSGLAAARELLAGKRRPTAIFAANDDMAAAAVAVAHGLHLRVPEDVAIAGFDDTPVALTVWPELTTIHQPIGEMGRAAVDLAVSQLRARRAGESPPVEHKLMPFKLEVRGSTVEALATP